MIFECYCEKQVLILQPLLTIKNVKENFINNYAYE